MKKLILSFLAVLTSVYGMLFSPISYADDTAAISTSVMDDANASSMPTANSTNQESDDSDDDDDDDSDDVDDDKQ